MVEHKLSPQTCFLLPTESSTVMTCQLLCSCFWTRLIPEAPKMKPTAMQTDNSCRGPKEAAGFDGLCFHPQKEGGIPKSISGRIVTTTGTAQNQTGIRSWARTLPRAPASGTWDIGSVLVERSWIFSQGPHPPIELAVVGDRVSALQSSSLVPGSSEPKGLHHLQSRNLVPNQCLPFNSSSTS